MSSRLRREALAGQQAESYSASPPGAIYPPRTTALCPCRGVLAAIWAEFFARRGELLRNLERGIRRHCVVFIIC